MLRDPDLSLNPLAVLLVLSTSENLVKSMLLSFCPHSNSNTATASLHVLRNRRKTSHPFGQTIIVEEWVEYKHLIDCEL